MEGKNCFLEFYEKNKSLKSIDRILVKVDKLIAKVERFSLEVERTMEQIL